MAATQGRSNTTKRRSTNSGRTASTSRKRTTTNNSRNKNTKARNYVQSEPMDSAIKNEIILIGFFALSIFLFLCNFKIMGVVGNTVSDVLFGIFGLTAYIAPVFLFLLVLFAISNRGNIIATRKIIAGVTLYLISGIVCELITGGVKEATTYQLIEIYNRCSSAHNGGGVICGSIAYLCYHFMGLLGTVLAILVLSIISIVILTEKSIVSGVKQSGKRVYERSKEDAAYRRERAIQRREQLEEERRIREEEIENEKILRMDKKVSGVMLDTAIEKEDKNKEKERDDIHEIMLEDFEEQIEQAEAVLEEPARPEMSSAMDNIRIRGMYLGNPEETKDEITEVSVDDEYMEEPVFTEKPVPIRQKPVAALQKQTHEIKSGNETTTTDITSDIQKHESKIPKKYIFPSLSLLQKGTNAGKGDSAKELKETALRLQQTLQNFGVKVTVTDISQGPTVTRYELQPEQGVKVSKIVGLADDIKLNLAATDIRIEAPIPGKAAVGIEVPNKENASVALRDLLEAKEFKEFPSKIAFAVGKDIGGKTVVADIGKMPHMLIAGATGSGKSVCINTLIMSILYKAHPDEVKLIMVDPKVVELSVYNGIPHLLIPVVTDPKKASAALHWGVAEMTDRYKKFADFNVRDLKGYNKKVESMKAAGDPEAPSILPQIIIIVDELADLMMVCPGEVEESICRLAQLARAAGIHLIIATQRPSVDVITGLIKANMPSRVAFSVSSGVDSRTILDMNGAEKLLGKGDMLFYPQGYAKPARIQGAFVSDKEVSDVVDFLKNQALGNVYSSDIEEKIMSMGSTVSGGSSAGDTGTELDQYFVEAGKFIIDKDKASIGMLQRVFKIGFNRAARIMDQLCEAGVVGQEEGTKPRKVLMSLEEFEQYIEECV